MLERRLPGHPLVAEPRLELATHLVVRALAWLSPGFRAGRGHVVARRGARRRPRATSRFGEEERSAGSRRLPGATNGGAARCARRERSEHGAPAAVKAVVRSPVARCPCERH